MNRVPFTRGGNRGRGAIGRVSASKPGGHESTAGSTKGSNRGRGAVGRASSSQPGGHESTAVSTRGSNRGRGARVKAHMYLLEEESEHSRGKFEGCQTQPQIENLMGGQGDSGVAKEISAISLLEVSNFWYILVLNSPCYRGVSLLFDFNKKSNDVLAWV